MPVSGHRWGSGPTVPGKEVMGFSKTGRVLGGMEDKGEEGAGKAEGLRKQI